MNIIDLNARGGIGANSLYCECGSFRFVIDSGIDPKADGKAALPQVRSLETGTLDFILLTHCHLDHLGSLPVLLRHQPDTPVFCSLGSAELVPIMLKNSYQVMQRIREEKGIVEYPLFSRSEIRHATECLRSIRFGDTIVVEKENDKLEITFYPAGHIPGACAVSLKHKHRKIFISGDVLFSKMNTLKGADFPNNRVDTLILETTRGATESPEEKDRLTETNRLVESISHTLQNGGSVLLPVFALGRMQELIKILSIARKNKRLPPSKVFAAGLAVNLAEAIDKISKRQDTVDFRYSLLRELKVQKPNWEIRPGRDIAERGIYLLGSGMLVENTPSYKFAASLLPHSQNSICFVGYCDPDTPGGKLLTTSAGDNFLFEALDYVSPVSAKVEKFDLSGHANREELLEFAISLDPRSILLTHGDNEARDWFHDSIIDSLPKTQVLNPEPLKKYAI